MLTKADVRAYLMKFRDGNPNTYANVLKSLKVFIRDYLERPEIIEGFRFPKRYYTLRFVPNKDELQTFYETLPSLKAKLYFLLYASSGLRRSELMNIRPEDINIEERMIIPNKQSRTKRTWLSFYNHEAQGLLMRYLPNRPNNPRIRRLIPVRDLEFQYWWKKGHEKTGIHITPQVLRRWFCVELSR